MIVVKFGGTSVGDAAAILRAADIVRSRLSRHPIVVVSALSGTTTALLAMAEQAGKGQLIGALRGVETLRERHLEETETLLGDDGNEVIAELSAIFDELASLVEALSVLGHLTPRSLDTIAALGEQLASQMVVAAFVKCGIPAELVDARQVVITDAAYTRAEPRPDAIAEAARRLVLPIVRANRVPVLGGFMGATGDGITTTLGRGGSDYSAALLGAALQAKTIEIWTDVDGMLTADPRVVEGARLIDRIRFDEASELASFGAKVLHPQTVTPAVEKKIPIRVLNTFEPSHPGTLIMDRRDDSAHGTVKAITSIRGMNLVTVGGRGMIGVPGTAARTFRAVAQVNANVLMISQSSSEQSICFVVPEASAPTVIQALRAEFKTELERHYIDQIDGHNDVAIIAVVGAGMRGTPGSSAASGRGRRPAIEARGEFEQRRVPAAAHLVEDLRGGGVHRLVLGALEGEQGLEPRIEVGLRGGEPAHLSHGSPGGGLRRAGRSPRA